MQIDSKIYLRIVCTSLLLIGTLFVSSLSISTHAFAAACSAGATDATTAHATNATAATCTLSEAFQMGTGALTINANTDAAVTFTCTTVSQTPPCVYSPSTSTIGVTAPFSFTAHVTDSRNLQSSGSGPVTQVGWHLNETFSPLTNDLDAAANITSITVTSTTPTCDATFTCTITPTGQLTAATFATGVAQLAFVSTTAGTSGVPQTSSGTYSLVTAGSMVIPSSAPAGSTYTGTVTLGLVSVPV